jgi:GNAT superfamily N-acetyltransferase
MATEGSVKVERLGPEHDVALRGLLASDPVQNLFLIGFFETNGFSKSQWYGIVDGPDVVAVALVLPGRLAVPWSPDPGNAAAIGRAIRGKHPPSMVIGPRLASDALWSTWAKGVNADRYYDQRLYVCREPSPGPPVDGFRLATGQEWATIAAYAGQMEREDLGRNPAVDYPELHGQAVRDRIRGGRTWVIVRDGAIRFLINVGATTRDGCQVGGTFVPPEGRGRGLATDGMRELARRLLPTHPMLTLHVNEANLPAVRVYEKAGFQRAAPFRLITVRG